MTGPPQSESRRTWLLRSLNTGIAFTAAMLVYPVLRFLRPRAATSSGATEVVAPYHVSELHPDPKGRWPQPFNFNGKPCLVVRTPRGEVRAFNAICTHAECTVEFRPKEADIFCNCHNGVYDLNGHVVSGPPPRPLEEYRVTLRGEPGKEEIIVSRNA